MLSNINFKKKFSIILFLIILLFIIYNYFVQKNFKLIQVKLNSAISGSALQLESNKIIIGSDGNDGKSTLYFLDPIALTFTSNDISHLVLDLEGITLNPQSIILLDEKETSIVVLPNKFPIDLTQSQKIHLNLKIQNNDKNEKLNIGEINKGIEAITIFEDLLLIGSQESGLYLSHQPVFDAQNLLIPQTSLDFNHIEITNWDKKFKIRDLAYDSPTGTLLVLVQKKKNRSILKIELNKMALRAKVIDQVLIPHQGKWEAIAIIDDSIWIFEDGDYEKSHLRIVTFSYNLKH